MGGCFALPDGPPSGNSLIRARRTFKRRRLAAGQSYHGDVKFPGGGLSSTFVAVCFLAEDGWRARPTSRDKKVMPNTQEFRGSPEHAIEELSRMCSKCDLQCSDCRQGCIVTMCIFFPEDALSYPFDMSRRSPAGALAEIAATMKAMRIKEVALIVTSPTTPEEHECEFWI